MRPNFLAFAGAIATTFIGLAHASAAIADDRSVTGLDPAEIPAFVAGAPGYEPRMHLCAIQVYLGKAGRNGANLRAGPGRQFHVLARIPGTNPDDDMGPEFQIIGSRNGWLLIHDPHWGDYGTDNRQVLYKGSAWIAPGLIDFDLEGYTLFSRPRIGAAPLVVLKGPREEWTGTNVRVGRVHGCSGGFLDMTVRTKGGQDVRGWFAAICGNQGTTCSFGDEPVLIEERRGKLVSAADLD